MTRSFLLSILVTLILSMPAKAIDNKLKDILSAKEIKRIESAEKLIQKGDAIVNETKSMSSQIDQLKNADGRIKSGKVKRLEKKVAQQKVKASLYYKDGYKKYIDVLDSRVKAIEKSGNSTAKQVRKDSKVVLRKAKKQYNKAENLSSAEKMVEYIELAQENQNKVITIQSQFLVGLDEKELVAEEPEELLTEETIAVDSISRPESLQNEMAQNDLPSAELTAPTAPAVDPTLAIGAGAGIAATTAVTPDIMDEEIVEDETIMVETPTEEPVITEVTEPVVEESIEESVVADPDVFLTIQFLAGKAPASAEKIESMYQGSKEVIEMHINDWYKYSIGKYQSLEEAKSDMQSENIKGFIVAYNKNDRISVKEAVGLLNGEI